jgi:hypothetical protein
VIQAKSITQAEQRLQVARTFLERTVQDLNESLQRCIAELVFDLDGIGISDWKNCRTKTVIFGSPMFGQKIHHGVSR